MKLMMVNERMPRHYTMHWDSQVGYWWFNGTVAGKCFNDIAAARWAAFDHSRKMNTRMPRIRGPICGAVWACKGNGHITSGMTPEEAYAKWLSWQGGAQ